MLQSTIQIDNIIKAAAKENMSAVALTDTGNMMAAFHFVQGILAHNKNAEDRNKEAKEKGEKPTENILKGIVGCEFNVCENHAEKTKKR